MIFSSSKSVVTGQMVIWINIIDVQTQVLQVYVYHTLSTQPDIQTKFTQISTVCLPYKGYNNTCVFWLLLQLIDTPYLCVWWWWLGGRFVCGGGDGEGGRDKSNQQKNLNDKTTDFNE